MHSFGSTALAVTSLLVVASAYHIDPQSVSNTTRESWCESEKQTCPLICQQFEPQTTLVNTCDPDSLTYGCLCGNNQKPNITEFTLTLPYFVCQEWGNQCVKACGSDSACASACREDHPCGASDPKKYKKSKTTSGSSSATVAPVSSTTSASPDTIYTGTPGIQDASSSSSSTSGSDSSDPGSGAAGLEAGRVFGSGMVVASLFGIFMLL